MIAKRNTNFDTKFLAPSTKHISGSRVLCQQIYCQLDGLKTATFPLG